MADTEMTEAQQATQARIEKLAPLRAVFGTLDAEIANLQALRGDFLDDPLFAHMNAVLTGAANLAGALAKEPTPPVEAPTEEPQE